MTTALIFGEHPGQEGKLARRSGCRIFLEEGNISAHDELMTTLYSPEERKKIEWAVGAIVNGDSRKIQKFLVLYGRMPDAGCSDRSHCRHRARQQRRLRGPGFPALRWLDRLTGALVETSVMATEKRGSSASIARPRTEPTGMPLKRTGESMLRPLAEPGMRIVSRAISPPRPYCDIQ